MNKSFSLPDHFLEKFKNKKVNWGFSDAAGNSLGEITFIRTYSRLKEDGSKEKWWEVCKRVIEGTYSIQKDYVRSNRLPWNDRKAQASAQEAFERMFEFKWTPPGRGIWMMGTDFIMNSKNSAALQNCGFVSSKDIDKNDPGYIFYWVMDALMLGVGIGWDTKIKEKQLEIFSPLNETVEFIVPDTREGWAESIRVLVNSYLKVDQKRIVFNYDEIRPYGEPIKGFGGTASGPEPLIRIHKKIAELFEQEIGKTLGTVLLADIFNLIGTCVVAGNVRRCLPHDALVQTSKGMISIGSINIGDEIVTGSGKHKVSAVMDSGVQDTIVLNHRFGRLECTPNHRVAVFNSFGSYEFKNASDIKIADRLVWDSAGYEGDPFCSLPEFKDNGHFNSKTVVFPKILNDDLAWLIGYIHGDGHVSKDGKSIEITAHDNYIEVLEKARRIFSEQFGVAAEIKKCSGRINHNRLRIHRASLNSWFQQNVKISNESINVPQFINAASISQRSAYLAGLMDADGRTRSDGVIEIAATKYNHYCRQIVSMLSGLGIGSSVSITNSRGEKFYAIKVTGNRSRLMAKTIMQEHGESGKLEKLPEISASPIDFSYPFEMIYQELGIRGWKTNGGVTTSWLDSHGFNPGVFLPTPVLSITSGRTVQTYDIEVEDVHQFTTDGIVVHNSAELAMGDPDDFDFINLKNPEIFPERNSYDPNSPGWGWMSNNSLDVKVGQDYSSFSERISDNGEPGFIWMDTTKKYGRLIDPVNNKDHRAAGYNPCLTGDTKLLTDSGLINICELAKLESFNIYNGDGKFTHSYAWYTGNKAVYSVKLSNGLEVKLTKNHIIEVDGQYEIEVGDLEPGMKIAPFFNTSGTYHNGLEIEHAEVYGLLFGDGYVQKNGDKSVYIKTNDPEIIEFLSTKLLDRFIKCSQDGLYRIVNMVEEMQEHGFVLDPLPTRQYPDQFFTWSAQSMRKFLKGQFSANGDAMPKYNRIDLNGISYSMIQDCQRILSALGYNSYIALNKVTDIEWDNGVHASKESYNLNIGSVEQYSRFQKEIGFIHAHKSLPCYGRFTPYSPRRVTVVSVDYLGYEPVYDFNETITHWGWANGIKVHNCAEQSLESFECCTLVEIHINRAESKEDFLRTLKFAYLYGKTVTLLSTQWDRTNAVMQRNRRIGTSITGIAGFSDKNGLPVVRDWLNTGYKEIINRDEQYSEWLGVRESIKKTSIKPSGTVSLLSGATPGVHWPPAGSYYLRAIRLSALDPLVEQFELANYIVEDDIVSANTKVVYLPIKTDVRSDKDVSIFEKINLAAEAQSYWADNSVSVTVSFDKKLETEYINTVLNMYEGKLKTVSFLPMGNDVYPQQPYTSITKEEYEKFSSSLLKIDTSASYTIGEEAQGERYCSNDVCEIPLKNNI